MRARTIFSVAAAVAVLAGGPARAESAISIDGVVVTDGVASVTGTFSLDAPSGPESVGGTRTPFTVPEAAGPLGIDLVDALIEQREDGLRFIWKMSSLPPVVPPEGIRYTWAFTVNGKQYQLQAKSINMGSLTTTEAPQAHVERLLSGRAFFQLRGNCTASYQGTPVAGCFHLAFLDGGFDAAGGTVHIDVPFGLDVAPEIVRGAVLVPFETAAMSIAASLQAVVSNTVSSQYINGWNAYHTAPAVELGVGSSLFPAEDAEYSVQATVDGSAFSGEVAGLDLFNDSVFARACIGETCVYDSVLP